MSGAIFLNEHIFSIFSDYLNDKEIIKLCFLTNKNMKNMIAHASNRHFLFYDNFKFVITVSNLENTIKLNSIVKLDFSDEAELTGTILLNLLQKCTNLKYIDISNTLVNEFEINYITLNFPTIKQCCINGIVISINLLENIIERFSNLEELVINESDISGIVTDQMITTLLKFKKTLKHLCLEECSFITSESLIPFLKDNDVLTTLDLYGCSNLDDDIIETISNNNCNKLSRISIMNTNISSRNIELLKNKYKKIQIQFSNNLYETDFSDIDDSISDDNPGDFFQMGYNEDWFD
jgi:hypothetical protein